MTVTKTTAPHVAETFLDKLVITYVGPSHVLSENGPQFVRNMFFALGAFWGTKELETTATTRRPTIKWNGTISR